MKAVWNGKVVAKSDVTVTIEGNHYFPPTSIESEYFVQNEHHTLCPWKGQASYYDLVVDGRTNESAAWYYPEPLPGAKSIVGLDFSNFVAFWHGVEVVKDENRIAAKEYAERSSGGQDEQGGSSEGRR